MKKTTLLLIIAILLYACKKELTPQEIVKQRVEEELMKSLNDPSSYEFVEMGKLDTIYTKDSYVKMVKDYNDLLASMSDYPERIEKNMNMAKEFRSYGSKYESDAAEAENRAKKLEEDYNTVKSDVDKYQTLLDNSKPNEIREIVTTFKCRANNKLGAKVLANYYVTLTDSLTIKDISAE